MDESHRLIVTDKVVKELQHQPLILLWVVGRPYAKYGSLAYIDPIVARGELLVHTGCYISLAATHIHFLNRHYRMAPNHLHRFRQSFPHNRSPQNIVAVHYRLQRSQICSQPFPSVESQLHHEQVRISFPAHQVMEVNAHPAQRSCHDVQLAPDRELLPRWRPASFLPPPTETHSHV